MPPTTPLQIWTADSTNILCSSINFTADGATLNNGGGTAIIEAPLQEFNSLSYLRQTQNPN